MESDHDLQMRIEANRQLYGFSHFWSTDGNNKNNFSYAEADVTPLVRGRDDIVVIPYATASMSATTDEAIRVFKKWGARTARSLHHYPGDEVRVLEDAGVIYITGGNTYVLCANLDSLRNADGTLVDSRPAASQQRLTEVLREKAGQGVPILGVSAGLLVLFQDIRGSDDPTSPIQTLSDGSAVVPATGLRLMPDNLRTLPHYADPIDQVLTPQELGEIRGSNPKLSTLLGQVRSMADHIYHVLAMDPTKRLIALRDGSYFIVQGNSMALKGYAGSVLFAHESPPMPIEPGTNLDFLLCG